MTATIDRRLTASQDGASKQGADLSPRQRDPVKNANDPRGQLGRFLRAWIDEHHAGDESKISIPMGISERAVRKWCEGNAAPSLADFAKLAKVLKFKDWAALALEIVAFSKSKNR